MSLIYLSSDGWETGSCPFMKKLPLSELWMAWKAWKPYVLKCHFSAFKWTCLELWSTPLEGPWDMKASPAKGAMANDPQMKEMA